MRLGTAAVLVLVAASSVLGCDDGWPTTCTMEPGTLASKNPPSVLDNVDQGGYSYWKLTIPDPVPEYINIAVSVINGDPDLYVKRGDVQPTFQDYDFTSRTSGNEDVIHIPADQLTAGEEFAVGVYGFRASQFLLMFSVAGGTTTLANGYPQTGSVAAQGTQYYRYFMNDPGKPLIISLTKLAGDPDLLVNQGSTRPTLFHHNASELSIGDDVIEFDVPADEEPGWYTIGVYGSVSSDYVLAATQKLQQVLLDGVPSTGDVANSVAQKYVMWSRGDAATPVTFTISVDTGTVEYFLESHTGTTPVTPDPTSPYHGVVSFDSPLVLTIRPGETGFLASAGGYYLTISGHNEDNPNAPNTYTVSGKTVVTATPLQDGEPLRDDLDRGTYRYYSLSVSDPTLDITVDITPLAGDPDMFISCSKNITGNDAGTPSRSHYTWGSQAWGEDTISVLASNTSSCVHVDPTGRGGTFFIAVYGFVDSTYTITATMSNGQPTSLKMGLPQTGSIGQNGMVEYMVQMNGPTKDLTITLTPSYGDPDLFVAIADDNKFLPPTTVRSQANYLSLGASGADTVVIHSSGAGCREFDGQLCFCDDCIISVVVTGFTPAGYTIVATSADATLTLQDGIPMQEHVSQHEYEYFKFNNPNAHDRLQFTVTPLNGDADMTISRDPAPTLATGTWVSVRVGVDQITIDDADAGDYYIGIYGFRNTTFTVGAHIQRAGENRKRLIPGIPQTGSVGLASYTYFSLLVDNVIDQHEDVTVTITPLSGLVGLIESPCAARESVCSHIPIFLNGSQWSSETSFSRESITVRSTDPAMCQNCVLTVGVYGYTDANFTVVANVGGDSVTTLQEYSPVRSQVDKWQYQYFKFSFSDINRDVVLSLTAFTGDPDMFIKACGYTHSVQTGPVPTCDPVLDMRPSNTSFTWSGASLGGDTLVIRSTDDAACVPANGVSCDYYIGVLGYGHDTSYSILGYLHSSEPVHLVDGKPQNGAVNTSVVDQYSLDVPAGVTDVEVLLIPLSGDADLYVTLDGSEPTQQNWDFRAIAAFGNDDIDIPATDPAFQTHCAIAGCTLRAGVLGFQPARYSIVATTSIGPTTLLPGVPSRNTVEQFSYDYFVFSVDADVEVTVVVTPVQGDPDVFVGWGADYRQPNASNYIWKSDGLGVDVVNIFPVSVDGRACDTATNRCNYYIGVYGFSSHTTFNIVAYTQDAAPVLLLNGHPQSGTVEQGVTAEYQFSAAAGWKGVQITLTPIRGDADLYVRVGSGDLPPSRTNAEYSSTSVAGNEIINVRPGDAAVSSHCPDASAPCAIRMGVYGYTNASYTISVSTTDQSVNLQDGAPLFDSVNPGEFQYYVYRNNNASSRIRFALTPFAGDPDLYVSTVYPRPFPPSNYTWRSAGLSRDVVEIAPDDDNACTPPCNYYVGVTAYAASGNATYSLLVTQVGNNPIQLRDGQPQVSLVGQGATNQYILYLHPGTPLTFVTLTPFFGDADLFARLGPHTPTREHHDYSSISSTGNDAIDVTSSDAAYLASACNPESGLPAEDCMVRVAVYGFSEMAFYMLSASTSTAQLLVDGSAQRDTATSDSYREYLFEVRNPNAEIVFALTPISGDPDMYVSRTPHANSTNYIWRASSMGADVIEIFPDDPNVCTDVPCRYFVGVKGFGGDAEYTLSATARADLAPTILVDGQPQVGFVNQSRTNLYYFDVPSAAPSFTVTVSPQYGDPDILMRLDSHVPRRGYAQFSSISSVGQDSVTVARSNKLFTNCTATTSTDGSHCRAFIAVAGFTDSQYTITAATSSGLTRLQDGVPARDTVTAPDYAYFVFTTTSTDTATVTLTGLTGTPALYMANLPSMSRPNSTANGHQWDTVSLASQRIVLAQSDPAVAACGVPCTYYLGVTARDGQSAAFQLMLTTNNSVTYNRLVNGQPQRSQVQPYQMTYFMYHAPSSPTNLQFVVTPLSGSVEVFVDNQVDEATGAVFPPTVSCSARRCTVRHSRWNSLSSADRATVYVNTGDEFYCADCMYVVAIMSTTTEPADFNIVATAESTTTVLQDGVPHSDSVGRHEYVRYRFVVTDPTVDVQVVVTPVNGDPDLFLSWHQDLPKPNATNYDARSIASNTDDMLVVSATDLTACAATTDGDCSVFIAVRGFTAAGYTIVVREERGWLNPTTLLDGQPLSGTVAANEWVYYEVDVNVPVGVGYTVSVTPSFGDPDMYITNDGREPTKDDYDFKSSNYGFDMVQVAAGDDGYCSTCTLLIGVFGFNAQADFSITFSVDAATAVTTLRDGKPVSATLDANVYKYYKIYVADPQSNLTLTIDPLSGHPNLFVMVESNSPTTGYELPTKDHSTWSTVTQSPNGVTIPSSDPYFRAPSNYVIGVLSESPTQFLLRGDVSNTMVRLLDGVGQSATVAAGEYKYFDFSTGGVTSDISFRLSSLSLQMFATNAYVDGNTSSLPTADNYMWTTSFDAKNTLTIAHDGPGVDPAKEWYTVGVTADVTTYFTLTATSTRVTQTLMPGTPSLRHIIDENFMELYRFVVSDPHQDLLITLVALRGNPDLYITHTDVEPTCTPFVCQHYTWRSNTSNGDVISIDAAAPCAGANANPATCTFTTLPVGTYIIGVYGQTASLYDIVFAPSLLVPGQPQPMVATSETAGYLHFKLTDTTHRPKIKISVALSNDEPVWVYITSCHANECTASDQQPGPMSPFRISGKFDDSNTPLFISPEDPHYCPRPGDTSGTPCFYYLGIRPQESCVAPDCSASVQVIMTLQDQSETTLTYQQLDGQIFTDSNSVDDGQSSRYQLFLQGAATGKNITLELEACQGPSTHEPTLFVCDKTCPPETASYPHDPANQGHAKTTAPVDGVSRLTVARPSDSLYVSVAADPVTAAAGGGGGGDGGRRLRTELEDVQDAEQAAAVAAAVAEATARLLSDVDRTQLVTLPVARALQGSAASSWSYTLRLSTDPMRYAVRAPSAGLVTTEPAGVTAAGTTIMGFRLSWEAAIISNQPGPKVANNALYDVYAVAGGAFDSTVQTLTACGLSAHPGLLVASTLDTSVVIDGLQPETKYAFGVVVKCDAECWRASGMSADDLYVPTAAYTVAVSEATPPLPPSKSSGGLTGAEVGAIVVCALVAVGVLIGGVVYCKKKAGQRRFQYELYDVSDMDGTYSTAGTYSAMD